jgi:hypothetical protein
MARAKEGIVELVDSGLFILATNPYTSGKLASIAREHGFRVKSRTIVRRNAPWSKARLYLAGMSRKQLERIAKFIEAIIEGRETGEIGEGKPAPVYIRKKFGMRKPRVYVSKAKPLEDLRAELAKIREAIAKAPEKVPAVALAPGVGRVLE